VTLGRSGDLGIDDTTVAAPRFVDELRRRLESHGDGALVVVRADATAHHAAVRALLESVREAGARRLAVATRPEGSR
jgi:biopolymer transport protein ExbD